MHTDIEVLPENRSGGHKVTLCSNDYSSNIVIYAYVTNHHVGTHVAL